jgi:cation diffusion facilitator family transporter
VTTEVADARATETRDRQVSRVIVIEGCANAAVLSMKLIAGLSTGSMALLSDAIHSLSDLANNAVAWFVVRLSMQPPDREHPYGHRKFETLAVFGLASLLTVLAFEIAVGAIRREPRPITTEGWALGLMGAVLLVNTALAAWEGRWARKLDSDILRADSRHTVADVLTTVVVIAGWQIGARGLAWLDTLCALGVAGLVLYLAYGLFRSAIPILVDRAALDPEGITRIAGDVPGVRRVSGVRSRWIGRSAAVDLTVWVAPSLTTAEAHHIADQIEAALETRLGVSDTTVHVEPGL